MSGSRLKFGYFSSMSGRERLKEGKKCTQGAAKPLCSLSLFFSTFLTLLDAVVVHAPY